MSGESHAHNAEFYARRIGKALGIDDGESISEWELAEMQSAAMMTAAMLHLKACGLPVEKATIRRVIQRMLAGSAAATLELIMGQATSEGPA